MRLPPGPLVVASHNRGKLREFADLLAPFGFEVRSGAELGLPEPEETGKTFAENAVLKAEAAAAASGVPALADDSGLCVDALGGDPGVYSARWAGPGKDFAGAMRRIEETLKTLGATSPAERRARFICALALARPAAPTEVFIGEIAGTLVWPPRGEGGFGYDPMFVPEGHDRSFGEMTAEAKHGWDRGEPLSHRARAFRKLADSLLPSGEVSAIGFADCRRGREAAG
jgi:XTP/dITP diphosphohydrolase